MAQGAGAHGCRGRCVTAREVMNRLRREGWAERTGKGSHVVFTKSGHRNIPVPRHGGDLPLGTLRAISRDAGWQWPPGR
jgi:predicted RNA binding protein YcfA (HicA-like mRNA interferase family)